MASTTDLNLRVTDTDREQCMQALRWASGQGALTIDELEERLTSAITAVYRRDLVPLTADLPQPAAAPPPPTTKAQPGEPSRFWIWAMIPWLAVGAWVHASLITRQSRYWPLVAIYAVPLIVAMLAAPGTEDELPGWAVAVGIVFWIAGSIQAWMARPAVDAARLARTS